MRAFGFSMGEGFRSEHGAVSGHALWRQQVAEVWVERFHSPFVTLVLGETVDVTETDGAEGTSAGCQGAPTGGERATAAAGGHGQRTGRQAGQKEEKGV